MSDHRPIRASFSVATKSVKRSEYVKVRELGVQSLGSYVDAQLQERLVHWTAHAGRLSYESALRRLGDCNWDIECVFRTP